jgi:hypothetical protein
MRRSANVLLMIACTLPCFAAATITYDHQTGTLNCGSASSPDAVCSVQARDGDVITVRVVNSVPGLFEMSAQRVDQPPEIAPASFVTAAGWTSANKPTAGGVTPKGANIGIGGAPVSVTDAYNALVSAVTVMETTLRSNLSSYPQAISVLRSARSALLSAVQPVADDPTAVAKAIITKVAAEGSGLSATETELADRWSKLTKFVSVAPAGLGDLAPQVFRYVDRDFDIVADIKPTFDLFVIPPRRFITVTQLTNAWTVRTTTGIAFSGLYDEHYTKRTNGTTTNVVTERRDMALPDATMLLHVSPRGSNDRHSLTLGIGIATGTANGRLYVGYGRKLGQVAAWTLGIAGGNVKRLSESIDRDNPGSADPEQSRRDVFKFAPFIGISVRIGSTGQ